MGSLWALSQFSDDSRRYLFDELFIYYGSATSKGLMLSSDNMGLPGINL